MNRGEMRNLLRERIQDTSNVWWPDDSALDRQLNLSAQFILASLSATSSWINYGRSSVSIETDGKEVTFVLTGVTDLLRPYALIGGADGKGGRLIPEREAPKTIAQIPEGFDAEGRRLAYLGFSPGEASPITITFISAPPAGTWTLIYDRLVSEIDSGYSWSLTLAGFGAGDSFTLTFNGQTTSAILYAASAAADVKAALEALSTIGAGKVDVSGSSSAGYSITIDPNLSGPALTCTPTGATAVVVKTGDDTLSYTEIPDQFHELVVMHAASVLLGGAGDGTANFAAQLQGVLMSLAGNIVGSCPAQSEPLGGAASERPTA